MIRLSLGASLPCFKPRGPTTMLVVCQRSFMYGPETSAARKTQWEAFVAKNCLRHHFPGQSAIAGEVFAAHMARFPSVNCIGEPTATLFRRSAVDQFWHFQ